MNITWLGQSCFKIEVKSGDEEVTILTYPFDSTTTGLKLPRTLTADLVLTDTEKLPYPVETADGQRPFVISGPGEYEVKGVFVYAIPLEDENGARRHIFWVDAENMTLGHLGSLPRLLSEKELREIEGLDILFTPIGGGEILDSKKAAELTNELEPRVVIPAHYQIPELKLKADPLEPFLKAIGAKPEILPKFKITRNALPVEEMKVVVLEKS